MNQARAYHTATLLANGKVLVVGGFDVNSNGQTSAEIYNPRTGIWTTTGSLSQGRAQQGAALLPSGDVLVVGGWAPPSTSYGLASAEVYHPSSRTWTTTTALISGRADPVIASLPSGQVLVSGGVTCCPYSIEGFQVFEIYDEGTATWAVNCCMPVPVYQTTAISLANGRVFVSGGTTGTTQPDLHATASSQIYDPTSGTWSLTGSMTTARERFAAALLTDGRVLAVGGRTEPSFGTGSTLSSAELYDPTTGSWVATGEMSTARAYLPATLLPAGRVLVAGGIATIGSTQALSSAEIFRASLAGNADQ
jgi:hypothetical protein